MKWSGWRWRGGLVAAAVLPERACGAQKGSSESNRRTAEGSEGGEAAWVCCVMMVIVGVVGVVQ
eukprot:12268520-Alexandrium_andersonii.AAC.1